MTRSQLLRWALAAWAAAALPQSAVGQPRSMNSRPIPATKEALPVIGCGTWIGFNHAPGSPEYARLPGVLAALFEAGGRVIDSSPMYGRSEQNTGDLLTSAGTQARAFLATKVWTQGRQAGLAQMEQSFVRLKTQRIDLMQVHNLADWRTHLPTLRDWKAKGRIRYIGITHYTASAYEDVEAVLRAQQLDFLQINYSLDAREAEQRLLPLAAERGVAVIVNMPFGGGGLLRRLQDKPLPDWAAEIGCSSWAQLLLKFVLGHPAATCAIPGTSRPEHMADNAKAGMGPLPDASFWRKHAPTIAL
ncbi:MAG TPA: aldo/keto reductase [Variovorax sp.]|nr:aldo/keto reductase [Variovorax sp.]